jgi:hypothetical protein
MVHFGLWEFSRTELSFNPHPLAVAWGGPLWGSLIPLVAGLLVRRRQARRRAISHFLSGFCLVANGAYIGVGWAWRVGDTHELLRLGTPPSPPDGSGKLGVLRRSIFLAPGASAAGWRNRTLQRKTPRLASLRRPSPARGEGRHWSRGELNPRPEITG